MMRFCSVLSDVIALRPSRFVCLVVWVGDTTTEAPHKTKKCAEPRAAVAVAAAARRGAAFAVAAGVAAAVVAGEAAAAGTDLTMGRRRA